MPAKVKVRILAGRNLPVMDKSSDASDAFVEVKLGNTTYKTEVYPRSLNPFWNSEWFRFEVSDQELQDEPLQIRVMDYDTYSANDAIGKVYINLNPLLVNPDRSMNGWLPIYDTLHGIRGEINCMVKVNLFADTNRYRQSSCGVKFFFSDIPNGYRCDAILGFVDELLVNDDPEHQWIDKIRTPRASNEARQTLFTKLSGEVQRKLGLKAEVFGGNAVIGFKQSFDLEGGSGIVGRGIGTAVILNKIDQQENQLTDQIQSSIHKSSSHFFPINHIHSARPLVHSVSADYFSTPTIGLLVPDNSSARTKNSTYSNPAHNLRSITIDETMSSAASTNPVKSQKSSTSTSTQSPSFDSISSNVVPNVHSSTSAASSSNATVQSLKARSKDKSVTTSADDALSIIEEKLDDENSTQPSSSTRPKQITRAEEIDLGGESRGIGDEAPTPEAVAEFAHSVRVIKAEQRILQSMIKHQNQHLVIDSMAKVKNPSVYPYRIHQSEYPFVTLKKYPASMIQCTGGVVSAHSVKLLDHIINDEESETRDIWWTEIRKEVRAHAKALNCNTILGYTETSQVLGDVCVLSACGTAAVMKPFCRDERELIDNIVKHQMSADGGTDTQPNNVNDDAPNSSRLSSVSRRLDCSFCHTPLMCAETISNLASCSVCGLRKVPEVLLLTIEPPKNLNIASMCTLVQARVCRAKRDLHGEANAKEIGDALPFLEYEMHRQLFSKLKFKGMNCLFNLSIDISVGENMITAVATGTGCFVVGLPMPTTPQISAGKGIKTSKLTEIQRLITQSSIRNRENLKLGFTNSLIAQYYKTDGSTGVDESNKQLLEDIDEVKSKLGGVEGSSDDQDYTKGDSSGTVSSNYTGRHHHHHHHHHHKHRPHHHHHHHHHKHAKSIHHHKIRATRSPIDALINLRGDENNIVLEVDDNEDADIIALLIDSDVPDGYVICNSETVPTVDHSAIGSINMFTQIMRVRMSGLDQFAQQFDWILQALFVKLRRSLPCMLTDISFVVDLPEPNVVQISVTGCLMGLKTGSDQPANSEPTAATSPTSSKPTELEAANNKETVKVAAAASNDGGSKRGVQSKSISCDQIQSTTSMSPNSLSLSDSDSSSTSSSSSSSSSSTSSSCVSQSGENGSASRHESHKTGSGESLARNSQSVVSSARATIATIRNELIQKGFGDGVESSKSSFLRSTTNRGKALRAVFKKQQTFPGAKSPAISGQDDRMAEAVVSFGSGFSNGIKSDNPTTNQQSSSATGAARRATQLLNKVTQPLKDLSSNFSNNNVPATDTADSKPKSVDKLQSSSSTGRSINGGTSVAYTLNSNELVPINFTTTSNSGCIRQQLPTMSTTSSFISNPPAFNTITNSNGLNALGGNSTNSRAQLNAESASFDADRPSGHSVHRHHHHVHHHHHHHKHMHKLQQQQTGTPLYSSIDITSLSYIPGAKSYQYLGNLSFSFVRETSSVRENGGLNRFIHCFLMEVYAIVRAHVSALGGNAILSFRSQQSCIFYHSNKNQAQCLISVAGDAVQVTV